jgi:hypothetical protein
MSCLVNGIPRIVSRAFLPFKPISEESVAHATVTKGTDSKL